jgi:hypothetical protein
MKLILTPQAKKMNEEWQEDDQDNIFIRVRQKQQVGYLFRGFIIFSALCFFAVMELAKMTNGEI